MSNGNGYTNKELLNIIIETQEKTNERIDLLHEKVNTKISRQELNPSTNGRKRNCMD